MDEQQQRSAKIARFQKFLDLRLKPDLQHVLAQRDVVLDKISEYSKLENNLRLLQQQKLGKIKTMVDLGCDFFVQAIVPDTSTILVEVGLGFHVEMTPEEVYLFVPRKLALLESQAARLDQKANLISAHIQTVHAGIAEVLGQQPAV